MPALSTTARTCLLTQSVKHYEKYDGKNEKESSRCIPKNFGNCVNKTTLTSLEDIKTVFQIYFELQLKQEQVEILSLAFEWKYIYGFLPTGYGDSLTFILPPLILEEVNIPQLLL